MYFVQTELCIGLFCSLCLSHKACHSLISYDKSSDPGQERYIGGICPAAETVRDQFREYILYVWAKSYFKYILDV